MFLFLEVTPFYTNPQTWLIHKFLVVHNSESPKLKYNSFILKSSQNQISIWTFDIVLFFRQTLLLFQFLKALYFLTFKKLIYVYKQKRIYIVSSKLWYFIKSFQLFLADMQTVQSGQTLEDLKPGRKFIGKLILNKTLNIFRQTWLW